jgi:phenylacetate-coenzyme A ligase PaaK-like adenylate-forming protein
MEHWDHWPPAYDDEYLPDPGQPYWFPQRETMDPELRDAAILRRIQSVMRYAAAHAPFYQRKWAAAGIGPEDIRSLDDFEQVPVVTKEELRRAQAEHPPFGDYLCVPQSEVMRVHGTSGTTGRPTAFGVGRADWRRIAEAHARVMWGMGIRPGMRVFIGSVFSLYMGSWATLAGAERIRAQAFPFGAGVAGQTSRAVDWLLQMRPEALYGTPSYALRIAEVAEERGIDPREFGIQILFFSGEPGASIPSIRKKIEDAFGGRVFDSGSMAEMTPWGHLSESTGHTGMLCWQDIVYTEVCDPATKRRVPFGAEGSPVYTHLERNSQPMIRLLSGDLTRWEAAPSPCGRTYPVLPNGIYGRIDDQFTVRGENIYPSAINDIVSNLAGYGGEHRIIVSREDTMDRLVVQVEHVSDLSADGDGVSSFRQLAKDRLRATLGVSTEVVVVPHNTFERSDTKTHRVIDERDLFREIAGQQ